MPYRNRVFKRRNCQTPVTQRDAIPDRFRVQRKGRGGGGQIVLRGAFLFIYLFVDFPYRNTPAFTLFSRHTRLLKTVSQASSAKLPAPRLKKNKKNKDVFEKIAMSPTSPSACVQTDLPSLNPPGV